MNWSHVLKLMLLTIALLASFLQSGTAQVAVPEIIVGIEIGLTHGTNGTSFPVISIEADHAYKDWMYAILHRRLNFQQCGYIEGFNRRPSKGPQLSRFQRFLLDVSSPFRAKTSLEQPLDEDYSDAIQQSLDSLVSRLKFSTEEKLGGVVSEITLAMPRFLNAQQRQIIHSTFETASMRSLSCRDLEDSDILSALSERQSQYLATSQPDALQGAAYGPIGAEQVLVAEYTCEILVASMFEVKFGRVAWVRQGIPDKTFVALTRKEVKGNKTAPPDSVENQFEEAKKTFWETVKPQLRSILPTRVLFTNWTSRLVVKGPGCDSSALRNTLEFSIGKIVSNSQQPWAIQISLSEEEIRRDIQAEEELARRLSCLYRDNSDEFLMQDTNEEWSRLIDLPQHNLGDTGGPAFSASRGAALLRVEMDRNNLSCSAWNDALLRFDLGSERWKQRTQREEL